MSLDGLPAELYDSIVSFFDPDPQLFQHTLAALRGAIPRSPIPFYRIFERIHLNRADSVFLLYRHLRTAPDDAARVRDFSLETWSLDADVCVNLLALLPSLTHIKMFIGPNFAPEHLQEIFQRPREDVELISLRFRPYVQRATYYQFLKGAYFDSTIEALSRWPVDGYLPALSIVQDPIDPDLVPTGFAQPMVFHTLTSLSPLAVSSLASELTHLRLRIPSRQVGGYISRLPHSFPLLEHLDLSTCGIREVDVEQILGQLGKLQALVLDGCPIVSQRADALLDAGEPFQQWASLGKTMALAGVKRAKEREKKLQAWLEQAYLTLGLIDDAGAAVGGPSGAQGKKRPKRGRRGLATATISLRAPEPEGPSAPRPTPPMSSLPPIGTKLRVLPSAPTVCSLATTVPSGDDPEVYEAIRAQFENGWAAGITQLSGVRTRLRTSWVNGVIKVVRFADYATLDPEEAAQGDEGLSGMEYIEDADSFAVRVVPDVNVAGSAGRGHPCPTLCLAGPGRHGIHREGCGHRQGWTVWRDDV